MQKLVFLLFLLFNCHLVSAKSNNGFRDISISYINKKLISENLQAFRESGVMIDAAVYINKELGLFGGARVDFINKGFGSIVGFAGGEFILWEDFLIFEIRGGISLLYSKSTLENLIKIDEIEAGGTYASSSISLKIYHEVYIKAGGAWSNFRYVGRPVGKGNFYETSLGILFHF